MAAHQGKVSDKKHKKVGTALAGDMSKEHKEFVESVIKLIDNGEIDPMNSQTFLNQDVYEKLEEEWKDKTDLSLSNLAHQIRLIYEFWKSTETPDESPHLETMVEQLWQTKQRIEEHADVFKF